MNGILTNGTRISPEAWYFIGVILIGVPAAWLISWAIRLWKAFRG